MYNRSEFSMQAQDGLTVVISPPGRLYGLDDLSGPGVVSVLIHVEAGGLEDFKADPIIGAYLDNDVPVVAVFESVAEAEALHREISRRSVQ